jgi:putative FmdB family regulatory protein
MPIYEYQCPACGHQFEQMVKMNAPTPPCPQCAGTDVRKLVSASGFILNGGGWYKDHYGLKSGGGDKKADAKPAAPAASGTGGGAGSSGSGSSGSGSSGSSTPAKSS